ncbi:hypothetical protein NE237_003900 [Protea cynaroides]|uniref:Uncharacterized protein n=1 Tax=Protea cynaroides TaxID=273540 RepID=A0A9Q0KIA1_9MAGN|nr:hypothetical protein NE237_003900 [Protea cynaroides]
MGGTIALRKLDCLCLGYDNTSKDAAFEISEKIPTLPHTPVHEAQPSGSQQEGAFEEQHLKGEGARLEEEETISKESLKRKFASFEEPQKKRKSATEKGKASGKVEKLKNKVKVLKGDFTKMMWLRDDDARAMERNANQLQGALRDEAIPLHLHLVALIFAVAPAAAGLQVEDTPPVPAYF